MHARISYFMWLPSKLENDKKKLKINCIYYARFKVTSFSVERYIFESACVDADRISKEDRKSFDTFIRNIIQNQSQNVYNGMRCVYIFTND